jgi:hypothetical protein
MTIYDGTAYTYNEISKNFDKTQFSIIYEEQNDIYLFFYRDYSYRYWLGMNKDNLNSFRNTLNKYLDWEQKAIDNKVELEKEIPDSLIPSAIFWKDNYDYEGHIGSTFFSFTFFSQNITDHQLVISFSKAQDNNDKYSTVKIDDLYLYNTDVKYLLSALSEANIEYAIEKGKKQQEVEKLFN